MVWNRRNFLNTKLFALAGLLTVASNAATLWDNGSFNSLGGSQTIEYSQAEDFVLPGISDLTGFRFWTLETLPGMTSIAWELRQNSAGSPGSVIAGGSGTASPTRTNVGAALGYTVFQNDVNIAVSNLVAGTYWLTLRDNTGATFFPTEYYWAFATLNLTNTPTFRGSEFELAFPANGWNTNSEEHAFQILGDPSGPAVPEPSTILLTSGALALTAWRGRKR